MSVITQRYTFSGGGEDFGPRKGAGLVILHTFENADPLKNTMRDALAGAIWQDRNDVLGSYNRLIAVDGVLSCVPDDRASGGVNPGSDYWAPKAWLYDLLPAYMVNDPNAYALELCAMGRRDYYDANGWPPQIIDGFARSIIEEEERIGRGVVVANHADFQLNRSDAGKALDLTMKRYAELKSSPVLPDTATEPEMPVILRPVREKWTTRSSADGSAGFFTLDGPGLGEKKWFTAPEKVESYAETADGKYRAVAYGNGETLWMERAQLVPVVGSRTPASGYGLVGLTLDDVKSAVGAALAAFNKNLDVWVAGRPKQ